MKLTEQETREIWANLATAQTSINVIKSTLHDAQMRSSRGPETVKRYVGPPLYRIGFDFGAAERQAVTRLTDGKVDEILEDEKKSKSSRLMDMAFQIMLLDEPYNPCRSWAFLSPPHKKVTREEADRVEEARTQRVREATQFLDELSAKLEQAFKAPDKVELDVRKIVREAMKPLKPLLTDDAWVWAALQFQELRDSPVGHYRGTLLGEVVCAAVAHMQKNPGYRVQTVNEAVKFLLFVHDFYAAGKTLQKGGLEALCTAIPAWVSRQKVLEVLDPLFDLQITRVFDCIWGRTSDIAPTEFSLKDKLEALKGLTFTAGSMDSAFNVSLIGMYGYFQLRLSYEKPETVLLGCKDLPRCRVFTAHGDFAENLTGVVVGGKPVWRLPRK